MPSNEPAPDAPLEVRAHEVFFRALAVPSEERGEFILSSCDGDDALRIEVEDLLRWHGAAGEFLESSPTMGLSAAPPSEGLEAGTPLAHYVIRSELGRGGMGIVYEAEDTRLRRRVAIKTLPPELFDDTRRLELFEREAQLTAAIQHPNIATIHSLEIADGAHFITLELIPGSTLAERFDRGTLDIDETLDVGRQLAAALEAAHAAGVVHRDLKPANIKLAPDGSLKVLDFGIATATHSDTELEGWREAFAGTPRYMSPEQFEQEPGDHRVDLWALGCILFECLTGEPALAGPVSTSPEPRWDRLPRIPRRLREVIERCLVIDAEERLGDATQARRKFEAEIARRAVPWGRETDSTLPLGNLTRPLTSLVGRNSELDRSARDLGEHRLITIIGVGGAGKTHLALELALRLADQFEDGVWIAELAPIEDPEGVLDTLLEVFDLRESTNGEKDRALEDHLCTRQVLLLLDNCEHVLEESARLAQLLVGRCPRLRILATSRTPLGVRGEHVVHLLPLSIPEESLPLTSLSAIPSVRLFCERARAVGQFELTQENSPQVSEICRRLEGIPLALEIAAANTAVLSVPELCKRLDRGLPVAPVSGGDRTDRQRTMEAALDWSYRLLTAHERVLLRRLSVLRGEWSLDAAEAVCSGPDLPSWEVLDVLGRLLAHSLVARVPGLGPDGESARFRLLEPVRQYARARVKDTQEGAMLTQRHGDHYGERAEELARSVLGPLRKQTLDQFAADYGNFIAVLDHCIESPETGTEPALRLVSLLGGYWLPRGRWGEGRRYCQRVLELPSPGEESESRAHVLKTAGNLAYWQGDYEQASTYQRQGIELFRSLGCPRDVAGLTTNLGLVAWKQGDYASARELYEEGLLLRREMKDLPGIASSLNNLGTLARNEEDYSRARECLTEAIEIRRGIVDRRGVGQSLANLGGVLASDGDLVGGRSCLEESLAIGRELGEQWSVSATLSSLSDLARREGGWTEALELQAESLTLRGQLGDAPGIAECLEALADIARERAEIELAARFLGHAATLRRATSEALPEASRRVLDLLTGHVEQSLGRTKFAGLRAEGERWARQEALEHALRFAGRDGPTPTPE